MDELSELLREFEYCMQRRGELCSRYEELGREVTEIEERAERARERLLECYRSRGEPEPEPEPEPTRTRLPAAPLAVREPPRPAQPTPEEQRRAAVRARETSKFERPYPESGKTVRTGWGAIE